MNQKKSLDYKISHKFLILKPNLIENIVTSIYLHVFGKFCDLFLVYSFSIRHYSEEVEMNFVSTIPVIQNNFIDIKN